MHNIPRWPDYIPFSKSELLWGAMCHCYDLSTWNWYTTNYRLSSFWNFLQNFNLMLKTKFMTIFPKSPVWNVIRESTKTLTSSNHISANIVRQALKLRPKVQNDFSSNFFFVASEMSQNKSYSENSTMTCLEQWNPRIQSSNTKCYETNSQKDIKER